MTGKAVIKEFNISVLVVDDELLARQLICSLVTKDPDLTVVGSCCDGLEAREGIKRLRPDLVFLDIELPGCTGVEVARSWSTEDHQPEVVFVTAFDRYAVRAFEVEALDYLLKPIEPLRFRQTLARVKRAIQEKRINMPGQQMTGIDSQYRPGPSAVSRGCQIIRRDDEPVEIPFSDITWVEGCSQNVHVHTVSHTYTLAKSLEKFQKCLPGEMFVRVQRSAMVNRARLRRIVKKANGRDVLVLDDGSKVTLSGSRKALVRKLLANGANS